MESDDITPGLHVRAVLYDCFAKLPPDDKARLLPAFEGRDWRLTGDGGKYVTVILGGEVIGQVSAAELNL